MDELKIHSGATAAFWLHDPQTGGYLFNLNTVRSIFPFPYDDHPTLYIDGIAFNEPVHNHKVKFATYEWLDKCWQDLRAALLEGNQSGAFDLKIYLKADQEAYRKEYINADCLPWHDAFVDYD